MNHIDKIIERECKGFIGDEPAACYTAKDLRALLQEVVEPYRKECDDAWAAFKGIRKLLGEAKYGDRLKNEIKLLDAAIAAEGK